MVLYWFHVFETRVNHVCQPIKLYYLNGFYSFHVIEARVNHVDVRTDTRGPGGLRSAS